MGTSHGTGTMVGLSVMALVVLATIAAEAQPLRTDFYDKSCPQIFSIVKAGIQKAVQIEKRMAASIVRLHFHDCFVDVSNILSRRKFSFSCLLLSFA